MKIIVDTNIVFSAILKTPNTERVQKTPDTMPAGQKNTRKSGL